MSLKVFRVCSEAWEWSVCERVTQINLFVCLFVISWFYSPVKFLYVNSISIFIIGDVFYFIYIYFIHISPKFSLRCSVFLLTYVKNESKLQLTIHFIAPSSIHLLIGILINWLTGLLNVIIIKNALSDVLKLLLMSD